MNSKVNFSLVLVVLAISILAFVCFLSEFLGVPVSDFTRDPLSVADGKSYFGLLSNIGIVFWSITLGICVISTWLLAQKADPSFYFFLSSAIFTTILLLDDLFMLHERFGELYLFAIYALVTLIYMVKYIKYFKISEGSLFLASMFFFSLSVLFDYFQRESALYHHLLEDGFKFFGITFWMGFFMNSSVYYLHGKEN